MELKCYKNQSININAKNGNKNRNHEYSSKLGSSESGKQGKNSVEYLQYAYSSPAGVLTLQDILKWFHVCDKRLRHRRSKGHSVAQSFRDEGYKLPKEKSQILKPGGSIYGHIKRAIVGPAVSRADLALAQLDGIELKEVFGVLNDHKDCVCSGAM